MTQSLSVAVIDDHALVREGLVATCESHPGVTVIYAGDSLDALRRLPMPPRLVLLDLDLHGKTVSADEAAELVLRGMVVLVVSALGSAEAVRAMLQAGVSGFVSKRDTTVALNEAIDAVIAVAGTTSISTA